MSEIKDGYYNGIITAADIIKSRYAKDGENKMEVELSCTAKDASGNAIASNCLCYLEFSTDYPKFGDTTKQQWQITMERLHALGFQGQDLTTINAQLSGKPCRLAYLTKDKNGVALKNPGWRLSAEREREAISGATANAMLAQMMGAGSIAPATPPSGVLSAAESEPNPFI